MTVEDTGGKAILPRTRKARAVLAVLALASPRPVLRLQLTALLWSQREKEQARASLRQAVHELHDTLGSECGTLLVAERHHLSLKGNGLWVDAVHGLHSDYARQLESGWFGRPLLEDLIGLDPAFDHWLEEERQRVGRIARNVAEGLLTDQQDPQGTLRMAEQVLAIDRTSERAWRAIIRIHADLGDQSGALLAYEQCCAALGDSRTGGPGADIEEQMGRLRSSLAGHPDRSLGRANGTAQAAQADAGRVSNAMPGAPGSARAIMIGLTSAGIRGARGGVRLGICPMRTINTGEDDGLAAGLTEEITTALSRFRWISCVSAASLAVITGETRPDILWSALDVDFVLDGSIQRSADKVRITARLMDMRLGSAVVWARRFDQSAADTLIIQDEIGAAIAAQLDPALLIHAGERAATQAVADPTAHELVLQAVPAIYRLERGGFHAAGQMLETALASDPGNAVAHAWYAYWHLFLVGQGWAEHPTHCAMRAAELAERAVMLDPGDARALTLAGHVRGFLGKRAAEAAILHDRALALNPNLAIAWCFSGLAQCYLGRHDEALRRMYQAVRLSPSDPHLFFFDMALIMPHLLLEEYESAIEIGRRAIELNPWFSSSYKGHLAALGFLGRDQEAANVLARLRELEPGFSVRGAIERSPMTNPDDLARYAEGLRRAGLPEESAPQT